MPARDDVQTVPSSPVPLAPRDGAVLGGPTIRFAWEPVEGATVYYVEVAVDPSFEAPVVEQSVGARTAWVLRGALSTEEQTYYWRVLAKGPGGWSRGERVESFVSVPPEEVEAHEEIREGRPEERLGPGVALVKSAGIEAAAEVTGDERLLEKEREQGVAHEGVEAGQIIGLAFASSVILLVLIPLLLLFWTRMATEAAQRQAAAGAQYPALRETEAEAARLLSQYGRIEGEAGVYRIPIDRAMQLLVNQGQDAGQAAMLELPLTPVE